MSEPDRVLLVDDELGMEAIVLEEDTSALPVARETDELRAVLELGGAIAGVDGERADAASIGHHIGGHVLVAALGQREGLVEEIGRIGDNGFAAPGVEAFGGREIALARNRVGAVERIIEAAPARVRGIERVSGVGHRHHQLRAADRGNLGIEPGGLDGEIGRLVDEIADVLEEALVAVGAGGNRPVLAVPVVDLRLHLVADGEQFAVTRREILD